MGEKHLCVSLGVCTLPPCSFPTTTDRYMEYFGEFTNKSLLQGKWHHGLHNMFRKDSFRSVHAFFRPTLRLKENPQKSLSCPGPELTFKTWVLRYILSLTYIFCLPLFFSLSPSHLSPSLFPSYLFSPLSLPTLSLENQLSSG